MLPLRAQLAIVVERLHAWPEATNVAHVTKLYRVVAVLQLSGFEREPLGRFCRFDLGTPRTRDSDVVQLLKRHVVVSNGVETRYFWGAVDCRVPSSLFFAKIYGFLHLRPSIEGERFFQKMLRRNADCFYECNDRLVFPEQAVGQAPIDTRPRGFDEVPPRALVSCSRGHVQQLADQHEHAEAKTRSCEEGYMPAPQKAHIFHSRVAGLQNTVVLFWVAVLVLDVVDC